MTRRLGIAVVAPSDIIDADLVAQLFGLACVVVPDPFSGAPMIVVRGRHNTGPTVRARTGPRRRTGIEPA